MVKDVVTDLVDLFEANSSPTNLHGLFEVDLTDSRAEHSADFQDFDEETIIRNATSAPELFTM